MQSTKPIRILVLIVPWAACGLTDDSEHAEDAGESMDASDAQAPVDASNHEAGIPDGLVVPIPDSGRADVTDCTSDRTCLPACTEAPSGGFELPTCLPDGTCECRPCEPETDSHLCTELCDGPPGMCARGTCSCVTL